MLDVWLVENSDAIHVLRVLCKGKGGDVLIFSYARYVRVQFQLEVQVRVSRPTPALSSFMRCSFNEAITRLHFPQLLRRTLVEANQDN